MTPVPSPYVLRWVVASVAAAAFGVPVGADAPHVYAIAGARIVPVVGAPIERGTVVVRNGLIEAVGASTPTPPDARVIEGQGLTVYPGVIDMSHRGAVEALAAQPPQGTTTREDVERWKRSLLLQPQQLSSRRVRVDTPDLTRLASAGITSVLAVPPGEVFKGQSALINVVAPDDEPQIGGLADERRGRIIVQTPVALHLAIPARTTGNAYPVSLMGVAAFVRQTFVDAQHYGLVQARYARLKTPVERPMYDEALDALRVALDRRIPVAFDASLDREIRRALATAREFALDLVIDGGHGAGSVANELKEARARVIVSLNYPTRPANLGPDADEPVRALRLRAGAPAVPAALASAGVPFAFGSAGLRDSKDFLKNAAAAVKAGLAADAAVRALTIDAATIAGAADRLGSVERGKVANLVVTDGDLLGEKTTIKYVFVDGRLVRLEPAPAASPPAGSQD